MDFLIGFIEDTGKHIGSPPDMTIRIKVFKKECCSKPIVKDNL
jgi:hypothetical protein